MGYGRMWQSWRRDSNCICMVVQVTGIKWGFLALRSMFEVYNPVCIENGQSFKIQFLTYVLLQATFGDVPGPLGDRWISLPRLRLFAYLSGKASRINLALLFVLDNQRPCIWKVDRALKTQQLCCSSRSQAWDCLGFQIMIEVSLLPPSKKVVVICLLKLNHFFECFALNCCYFKSTFFAIWQSCLLLSLYQCGCHLTFWFLLHQCHYSLIPNPSTGPRALVSFNALHSSQSSSLNQQHLNAFCFQVLVLLVLAPLKFTSVNFAANLDRQRLIFLPLNSKVSAPLTSLHFSVHLLPK